MRDDHKRNVGIDRACATTAHRISTRTSRTASTGQTFREDEVRALDEIFRLIARGADPRIVARTEPAKRARKKVHSMLESIKRRGANGLRLLDDHDEGARTGVDGSSVDRSSGIAASDGKEHHGEEPTHPATVSQESLRTEPPR